MAFMNGKYTAFDPQINMVSGVVDDDENCVINGEWNVQEGQGTSFLITQCDKTESEVAEALGNGKRIWFTYSL